MSACSECPMSNKTLSIKPANHHSPSYKDAQSFPALCPFNWKRPSETKNVTCTSIPPDQGLPLLFLAVTSFHLQQTLLHFHVLFEFSLNKQVGSGGACLSSSYARGMNRRVVTQGKNLSSYLKKNQSKKRTGGVAQVVEYRPANHEALSSSPNTGDFFFPSLLLFFSFYGQPQIREKVSNTPLHQWSLEGGPHTGGSGHF
jgi:hypothetical protein